MAHLNQAIDFNPRGSWEHRAITDVNLTLLTLVAGSDWRRCLPDLAPGWEHDPELEMLTRRAREVIRRDFDGMPVWGWKDPKTSLLLPFWQNLLPPFQRVICLRDPADVVRSATRKFGYSAEQGVYVWLRFLESALANSTPQDTVFIGYEDWLDGAHDPLKILAGALGTPERAESPQVRGAIAEFVEPTAGRNHRNNAADDAMPGRLLEIVRPLYDKLNTARSFDEKLLTQFRQACVEVAPTARDREMQARAAAHKRWLERVHAGAAELRTVVPVGETLIIIDEAQFPHDAFREWSTVPFPERDGHYWGPPPNSATALAELDRLRSSDAGFIAFGWPAFWWLDYYADFANYLHAKTRCALRGNHFVVFDLRC
jgi:hypothetical protein